jgi:L-ascorbate metabolism protein UlaG (beta-lactamase superfamily)
MRGEGTLRFSPFVAPQVRAGSAPLHPQNMSPGEDRVRYLHGAAAYLTHLLQTGVPLRQAIAQRKRIPMVGDLLEIISTPSGRQARPRAGAEDHLRYERNRLTVCFPDGRSRTGQTFGIQSGEATPLIGELCQALRRGETPAGIRASLGERLPGVSDLIAGLRSTGLIIASGRNEPAFPIRSTRRLRFTWLGHAAVVIQALSGPCWVDPWLPPRIRWTPSERRRLFSHAFADAHLFEGYGPEIRQLSPHDLEVPSAVFITHQDRDHVDVGLLMTLPDSVQIVVPECSSKRAWEVDLKRFLRSVLGERRRIRTLGHGETLALGDLRVTAFPFRGEMPAELPHSWNCYLFESATSAIACTADSNVGGEAIDFLTRFYRRRRKPITLMATYPFPPCTEPGMRESPEEIYNPWRLYSWYLPVLKIFSDVSGAPITLDTLRVLKKNAGVKAYFAYAMGSAPWFRLRPDDPLAVRVTSLTAAQWGALQRKSRSDRRLPRLIPARYSLPMEVD